MCLHQPYDNTTSPVIEHITANAMNHATSPAMVKLHFISDDNTLPHQPYNTWFLSQDSYLCWYQLQNKFKLKKLNWISLQQPYSTISLHQIYGAISFLPLQDHITSQAMEPSLHQPQNHRFTWHRAIHSFTSHRTISLHHHCNYTN